MHYGHFLKRLHDNSKRTKSSVAKAVNMDISNYAKLLEREDMKMSTFHKVCKELNGAMGDLDGTVLGL
jgi:DNA-binding Xre family transcriptional regulator